MHLSLSPQRPAFSHTGNSPSPTRTLRSFEHSSSEMGFLHSCHHHRPAVSRECPRKYSGLQQRTAEFRTRVAGRTLHELQDNATGSANNTAGANSTAARCNRPSRGLLPIERANWSNSFEPFFSTQPLCGFSGQHQRKVKNTQIYEFYHFPKNGRMQFKVRRRFAATIGRNLWLCHRHRPHTSRQARQVER